MGLEPRSASPRRSILGAAMAEEALVVLTSVGSPEEADRISVALVNERLAACVNIVGGVKSVYWWKGAITREDELLLVIKTAARLFDRVRLRIKELHRYELPEVIALPLAAGDKDYLAWVRESVAGTSAD